MSATPMIDFCFIGGNVNMCSSSVECTQAFREVREKLIGYYPVIFPGSREAPKGHDIVLVDMPLPEDGEARVFCVFFRMDVPRSFWNVLCFSYSPREWGMESRRAAMDMTPEQWLKAASKLNAHSRQVELEIARPGQLSEHAAWDGSGIYVENYPLPGGKPLSCTVDAGHDWMHLLQFDIEVAPVHVPPPAKPRRSRRILRRLKNRFMLICIVLLLAETAALIVLWQRNQSLQRQNDELGQTVAKLKAPCPQDADHRDR